MFALLLWFGYSCLSLSLLFVLVFALVVVVAVVVVAAVLAVVACPLCGSLSSFLVSLSSSCLAELE